MRAAGRLILSFACVLLAFLIWFAISFVLSLRTTPPGQSLRGIFAVAPVYLVCSIPGWLVSLPFVVKLRDAEGRRGWITLIIGVSIGPAIVAVLTLVELIADGFTMTWKQWLDSEGFTAYAASIISFLTTVCYVSALKIAGRLSPASSR